MSDPPDIDAVELVSVQSIADGSRLRLRIRGQHGETRRLSMPATWLNELVNAVPQPFWSGHAHRLASWNMEPGADGEILLTLRTPEGHAYSFAIKPWQVQGMATLAIHGHFDRIKKGSLH